MTVGVQSCDRGLVMRAQSGEKEAFNELISKYRLRVMRVSFRYTRNLADAEDAAQNTFLKAYRGLANFRGDCAFYSWLHRIAINSAKNVRSIRARDGAIFAAVQSGGTRHEAAPEASHWETPESLAVTEEMCIALNGAMQSLCQEQRTALELRELEGLSYSAVARSMSCPIGTVRSRVFRAREVIDIRLRRVFEDGLGRAHVGLAFGN